MAANKIKTTTLTSFDDYNIKETLRVVYGASSESMNLAYEGLIYNAKDVSADGVIDVKFSVQQQQSFVVVTGTAVLLEKKSNSDGRVSSISPPVLTSMPSFISPPVLTSMPSLM